MLRRQSTTNNIFHVEHVDKASASFEGGRKFTRRWTEYKSLVLVEKDMLSFV